MLTTNKGCLLSLTTALILSFASPTRAETLNVDPDQSFLKLEVLVFGTSVATAQVSGSDKTTITGTLEATIASGQITLNGGSNLDFSLFDDGNTNLLPDVGGGAPGDPGTGAPADMGLDIVLAGLGGGPGAVRLAVADITGGPTPVAGGLFNASGLTLGLTGGTLDANLSTVLGDIVESVDISGNSAINVSGGSGYTAIVDGFRYVKIPINLDVELPVDVGLGSPLIITARFTGQIATVPEPSSIVLLGIACIAVPAVGYRRLRRRS